MKTGAVIAIVAGVVIVLYFAVTRGLIGSGAVPLPGGGVAPNPAKNYSGYLAATTAPQVSGVLNTVLAGLNSGLHSWLAPSNPGVAPAQGANPGSPSYAAQPSGPVPTSTPIPGTAPGSVALTDINIPGALVGPITDPSTSYNSTSGAAFDYAGLSDQNAYDSSQSLYDGAAFA